MHGDELSYIVHRKKLFTYIRGNRRGEGLIILKHGRKKLLSLHLYDGNSKIVEFSNVFIERLLSQKIVEEVEILPDDIFSEIYKACGLKKDREGIKLLDESNN